MPSDKTSPPSLWKAFNQAEFAASHTLNLRESLPTVADARFRTEQWLRERQVSGAGKVLVITGRGNSSPDGVSPVREGVQALFHSLRRRGVVTSWKDRSEGAFEVTLAPITALLEAPRRKRHRDQSIPAAAATSLAGLDESTVALLRRLAQRSLEALGARVPEKFVEAEMLSRFSLLAGGLEPGPDGERRLRDAIVQAIDELDD
ncbi:MAG TPA: Smr/MutS family protein [Gemmatimonadaceae bacterium]|nr:Smr/MutS family protein [Gemmatimonadaceae bacterium]